MNRKEQQDKEVESGQKRVLVVATTMLRTDGLTALLIYLAEIVSKYTQVHFLLGEGCEAGILSCVRRIGEVHGAPSRKKNLPGYLATLRRVSRGMDLVHIHGNSATMALDLWAVRGVPVRITHCHNCAEQPLWKQRTLGVMLNRWVTDPVACSQASGKMLYTHPFTVLTNGIDCERFAYSREARDRIRRKLGLAEDAYVIGHVGRFTAQKNQQRLIRIFQEVLRREPKSWLMLCGVGETQEECIALAQKLSVAQKVFFVGAVEEPEAYYAAMDVFTLPSLFEGLPLAGLEAQASGLPCVFSDAITKETQALESCCFLSLRDSDREWAEKLCTIRPVTEREKAAALVDAAGYNEQRMKGQVLELYGSLCGDDHLSR